MKEQSFYSNVMVCVCASVNLRSIKSRRFLALAHLGGPGKRAVKRLWCGGLVSIRALIAKI